MAESYRHHKEQVGIVLSNRQEKTAVVQVMRLMQHPTYKKVVRRRKKYVVHDEKKITKIGDKVRIVETKPISKNKCWRVAEILSSVG